MSDFSASDLVYCIIAGMSAIVSCGVLVCTFLNLREIKKQFAEHNRGRIVFQIDKNPESGHYEAYFKNYGNSPAKLLEVKIEPDIKWCKEDFKDIPYEASVADMKNMLLAPDQIISILTPFKSAQDKIFEVAYIYETCGKSHNEKYTIDLRYRRYWIRAKKESKE